MLKLIKSKSSSGIEKDVIWTFSLQIAVMLCSFIINKFLASRLSTDDFGQYNVIKRSVQVLSFVMLAGVGIALPRYITLYKKGQEKKSIAPLLTASLIYICGVTIIVCLICVVFNNDMQRLILGENDNLQLLIIALAYAFALAMAQFAFAYYRGIGDFKWYNGSQLGVQLAIILPLIFLPMLTATNVFSSWLIITAAMICFYIGRVLWINGLHHPMGGLYKELKTIIKYSSGRLLADFFLFSLAAFPLIYISNTLGLQPTAYYSVGITLVTMVTPLFSFMGIILLPYVAECIAKKEMMVADHFVKRLAMLYVVSSLSITALLYLFIDFFTSFLFSENYLMTTDLSRIMLLSILPQAIYRLYRNPIDAVSVIPYNTIILGICLAAMITSFRLSATLTQLAWAYLGISCLQGLLSWLTWLIIKKKGTAQ